jgi:hypothetical protein
VERSQYANIMTLTKIILATAGATVNDLCLGRLSTGMYQNSLQKDINTGIF